MNYYNQGQMQGYGRQMGHQTGRQMPYHNPYQAGMQMHGNRQFQGGHPNNFRLPQLINQGNQFQGQMPGMNPTNFMQPTQPMQPMNPMHPMHPMHPMNPMNPALPMQNQTAQQPMGPVTFEPYNPAENTHMPSNTALPPNMGANNPIQPPISPVSAPAGSSNSAAISAFIQGESNAFRFYSELRELGRDGETRAALSRVADNASGRKALLGSLYNKMTGTSHTEKDLPIMKSTNLRQGIRTAIEIENNTVREMSALYDQIDNGMHLKSLNSVIQKKLIDILSLQQLII